MWKRTVFAEFWTIRLNLSRNCAFLQNIHTRKLVEITRFSAMEVNTCKWKSREISFLSIRKNERFNLILSTIEKFKFSNFIESFQIQTSKNRAITTKNRAITTKNRAITTNNRAITTKTARSKEGIINYFQDWVRNYYSPWEWTLLHYSFMFKYYRSPVKEMMLSSTYIFSYSNKSFASVIKRYLFGS